MSGISDCLMEVRNHCKYSYKDRYLIDLDGWIKGTRDLQRHTTWHSFSLTYLEV